MNRLVRYIWILASVPIWSAFASESDSVDAVSSNLVVRVFSEYKKPSLIFQPEELSWGRDRVDALVYLPNVGPSLGAGIEVNDMTFFASIPMARWQGDSAERGKTKGFHSQLHKRFSRGGVDATYSDLRGFFLNRIRVGSVQPLNDVLVKGDGKVYEQRPNLVYQSISGGGYYFLSDERRVSLQPSFSHERASGFFWTPLIAGETAHYSFRDEEPIIPLEDRQKYKGDGALTGGITQTVVLQGGVAANWRRGIYSFSTTAAWGPSINQVQLTGVDQEAAWRGGNAGRVEASMVYDLNDDTMMGLSGLKRIRSYSNSRMTVTETTSLLELFIGRRIND